MNRLVKVFRFQKAGDAVHGFVVDHDRAEQRLLRLDVVRRRFEVQRLIGVGLSGELIGEGRGLLCHDEMDT